LFYYPGGCWRNRLHRVDVQPLQIGGVNFDTASLVLTAADHGWISNGLLYEAARLFTVKIWITPIIG
jgi:hypothetical protein